VSNQLADFPDKFSFQQIGTKLELKPMKVGHLKMALKI